MNRDQGKIEEGQQILCENYKIRATAAKQAAEKILFVIPFTMNRAKCGIRFSSRLPRKSRFLGQTSPFGMTRWEFIRSL
jgi:hypothetical protein